MAILTTLVSFNGVSGNVPYGNLMTDAAGDLFGTASLGGAYDFGTVFEVPYVNGAYATTPVALASFNHTDGSSPEGTLIADAAGNLLGTTLTGGATGVGTVFEIANTNGSYASTPTTVVSFNATNGSVLQSGLVTDTNGDLFGTTLEGGTSNLGTVFEIVNNGTAAAPSYANAPTTLLNFTGVNNGQGSFGNLITDARGDLFGTAGGGGTYNLGEAFELVNIGTVTAPVYSTTPIIMTSFNGTDGSRPAAGLIADSSGNLFGTTYTGGASNDGTVFELVNNGNYNYTLVTLASFSGANGQNPAASLIEDAAGDFFGTTTAGGANNDGTVFELVNNGGGSYTLNTLVNFNGANGDAPASGLIADAAGNLYGETQLGGVNNLGTVFELSNSGFQVSSSPPSSGTTYTASQINAIYEAVLQRPASPAEQNMWVAAETGGQLTEQQVLSDIVTSAEANNFVYPIIRLYQAAFGRVPDQAGLTGWVDTFESGAMTEAQIDQAFVNSPEFLANYGTTQVSTAFVGALYHNVLGRTGSTTEISGWVNSGESAAQILQGFSDSTEFQNDSRAAIIGFLEAAANGTESYHGPLL